jgi:quinol monooxygenase YgiN
VIYVTQSCSRASVALSSYFTNNKLNFMVKLALLVRLEAKPGKEKELEDLLVSALPMAQNEPDTIHWFALRIGPSTYGIFDTFEKEDGRQSHLNGPIAAALVGMAPELLSKPPVIEQVGVLAVKAK